MAGSLDATTSSCTGVLSTTGLVGGVAGRGSLASAIFGEGSLFEGPRILAKDMGLLARSGFWRTKSVTCSRTK